MKKTVWTFGLIAGVVLNIWVIIVWLTGRDMDPSHYESGKQIGYTVMILSMCLIFFAIKQVRDKELGGTLTFNKGILIGVLTNLVASTLFGLFNIVYMHLLSPDFLATYFKHFREGIATSDLPQAEISQQLADFDASRELLMNPEFNAMLMFATVFLIGLVVTVVSAVVLRRN